MLKILAIDPGEKVGWATAEVNEDHMVPYSLADHKSADLITFAPKLTIVAHGISPLKTFALRMSRALDTYDVVIYESWRLASGMARRLVGNDMQTSQLIGMIRLCAWQSGTKLVSQAPVVMNTAKKTVPSFIQEILDNEPKDHDSAHNCSALLHLWHYYWEKYV